MAAAASLVLLLLLLSASTGEAHGAGDEGAASPEGGDIGGRTEAYVWRWSWDRGVRYDVEVPFDEYWIGPERGPLSDAPLEQRFALVGRIGAILQVDAAGYGESRGLEGAESGIELRRFRFGTRGDFFLLGHVSYSVDLELVASNLQVGDVYLWWDDVPFVRSIKVGNFTPPFSLESVTAARDTVLMETGLPVLAFAPGRSAGIQIGGPEWDRTMTWAVGAFQTLEKPTAGDQSQQGGRATGRLTWLAEDERSSQRLTHLGLAGSMLFAAQDVRYSARPESQLAPAFVDTGVLRSAEYSWVYGAELATVRRSWTLMSEVLLATVRGADTVTLWGTYVTLARFLSDDSQPYDRKVGRLARFDPPRPFSWSERRWGALRAAGRVSHVDLSAGAIDGGRETNLTADLTWFLDYYLTLKLEYGLALVRGRPNDGNLHFVQARFQFDFY